MKTSTVSQSMDSDNNQEEHQRGRNASSTPLPGLNQLLSVDGSHPTSNDSVHSGEATADQKDNRRRSAFSVAKKRPPGSYVGEDDDDDDDDDDDNDAYLFNGDIGVADTSELADDRGDRDQTSGKHQSTGVGDAWVVDMKDDAGGSPSKGLANDRPQNRHGRSDRYSSASKEEDATGQRRAGGLIAKDGGKQENGIDQDSSLIKGDASEPNKPQAAHSGHLMQASPDGNNNQRTDDYQANGPLFERMARRKRNYRDTSGHSQQDENKSSFSGKSTLPRSNTLSSGLTSEVAGDDEDCINVVVRVRPLSQQELQRHDKSIIQFPGDGAIWIDSGVSTKSFTFNVMFEPQATQEDVFEHSGMKKLVEMALGGYSCTAFAFGQTGSGKTHTITGPPELFSNLQFDDFEGRNTDDYGLLPRSFHYLFHLMRQKPNTGYRIAASYLEIYNEQVVDLLNPNQRKALAVRWSKNKGFYVENLFTVECESIDDLMAVLEEGLRNRATGANSVNEHSSRSHSMLTLNLDSEMQDPDEENLFITKHGKLTFVDLAGSEKTKTDIVTSQEHLVESNNINRSLLVLGNCISALGDSRKRNGHIPYRDSKLTKLLADSLGGNGVTLMIACVSPSSYNSAETMNTLRYANRAKKIKTKPVIKMDPRERLIVSLKREIKVLRQENHYLRQQLDFPVKPRGQLQKENDQRFMQMLKEYKKDGNITDHGLYEMLQEYMIENETLRTENTDLHTIRDQARREQQTLARENERLLKKLELLEKERMLVNTPISIYSVGSTVSRRSSGIDSQYDSRQPQGTPPNWPNHYNKDTPRNHKKTPPSYLQHPQKPPHRLSEPVNKNNPGYLDSPRNNGYTSRYNQMNSYRENQPSGSPAVPHQGAAYPEPKQPPNRASNTQNASYGKGPPKAAYSQEAPVAQTRKNKGAPAVQNSQPQNQSTTGKNNYDYVAEDDGGESVEQMNDRLRQELLDLEGQIKHQSRVSNSQQPPSPTKGKRAIVPAHGNTYR